MDGDVEVLVAHFALDDGGEEGFVLAAVRYAHLRSAAYDLCPGALLRGRVVLVVVLVCGDDELAMCFLEQWRPHSGAGALPHGEVGGVAGILVVGRHVAGVMLRVVVVEGYMAEGDEEWSTCYLLAFQRIAEPLGLCLAVGFAVEESCELGVRIELVLGGIETDESDVTHAHGEIAPEIPVARLALLGLAVHPNALEMTVGHTAQVVVARAEQVGNLGGVVATSDVRREVDALLCLDSLFNIAGVAVPDDT